MDWLTSKFVVAKDGDLAVLHNRNKMVNAFATTEWVAGSGGAIHPRVPRLHLMVVDLHRRWRMADGVLKLLSDFQVDSCAGECWNTLSIVSACRGNLLEASASHSCQCFLTQLLEDSNTPSG